MSRAALPSQTRGHLIKVRSVRLQADHHGPAKAGHYVTRRDYVIISPQADRSRDAGEQSDEFLVAGVCDEDQHGITVRGAKMLATGCRLPNEVFVGAIQPLKAGEEKHSCTAMVPLMV
jgi:aromatic ring hydroxylase